MDFSRILSRQTAAIAAALGGSCLLVSGCMGPTYGTGTPAEAQLFNDVSSMADISAKKKEGVDTKPRPPLVKPASTADLPPPQQDVASAGDPNWPESPEERLAKLKKQAAVTGVVPDELKGDTSGGPTAAHRGRGSKTDEDFTTNSGPKAGGSAAEDDTGSGGVMNTRRSLFSSGNSDEGPNSGQIASRVAQNNQGDPNERKYLSEPPLTYRQPAPTAATNDLGTPEWKKERDRKKAAQKHDRFSWSDLNPSNW